MSATEVEGDCTLTAPNLGGCAPDHGPEVRGRTVGRYIALGCIGRGGMGVVYRAYDPDLQREVALKLLRDDRRHKGSVAAESRLRREAQAMARISHPNVLPVYDVGVVGGHAFVAMEFVRGQSLHDWLTHGERSWREIVELFAQAGEGLAAAHAVDLVHRDFKPQNVLICAEGRARVMDFGLARALSGHSTDSAQSSGHRTETPASTDGQPWADSLDTPLTATGSVVGTPRYMAPEQHRGLPTDARSDQFSFCAALFEALFRIRPFGSGGVKAMGRRKVRGELRLPDAKSPVPLAVRCAIMRGLNPDPGARFDTMHELLRALGDPPTKRRRRLGVAAAVVTVLAGTAGFAATATGDSTPCQGGFVDAAAVWNPGRRAVVRQGLLDTQRPYAQATWDRLAGRLEDFAADWTASHAAVCEATHVHGDQSPELLDVRMACLGRQLDEFDALLSVFAGADGRVLQRAASAAARLGDPARCQHSVALVSQDPPPRDPQTRKRYQDAHQEFARGRALTHAGRADEALAILGPLVQIAREIGYRPFHARVLSVHASAVSEAGEPQRARELAVEALNVGLACHAGRVATETAVDLVWIAGYDLGRHEEAHQWARTAEALLEAHGDDPMLRASLLNSEAVVWINESRLDEANAKFEGALSLLRRADPNAAGLGIIAGNAGALLAREGDYAGARAYLTEGLEHQREHLGPEHPNVQRVLVNLASVDLLEGDYARAEDRLEAALAPQEGRLGRDHPDLSNTLNNLASVNRVLGRPRRAAELHRRALGIREATFGSHHVRVAESLDNLATALRAGGALDEARHAAERALQIRRDLLEPTHPAIATSQLTLGRIAEDSGKEEQALQRYEQAIALRQAALGRDHPLMLAPLLALADAKRRRGGHADARAAYERALAIGATRRVDRVQLADARFGLARVIAPETPERARRLAERALGVYREFSPQRRAQEIKAAQTLLGTL